MSNPRILQPQRAELHEILWKTPRPRPNGDVYLLLTIDKENSNRKWTALVHVAPRLRKHFDSGTVEIFDLHSLELNGPTVRHLPLQPEHIVLGARLNDGTLITDVPLNFVVERRRGLRRALWPAAAAIVGATAGVGWALTLLLPAIYIARKALLIPVVAHPALAAAETRKILVENGQACTTTKTADSKYTK